MNNTSRILSCGTSLLNYYNCVENEVVGFKKRYAKIGDLIYISAKPDLKESLCGVRGVIVEEIESFDPWVGAEEYSFWYKIERIQFCTPFSLKVLSKIDNWSAKFMQLPKPIVDESALKILNDNFSASILPELFRFETNPDTKNKSNEISSEMVSVKEHEVLNISGTYRTTNFISETHSIRGIEPLVNRNFHQLFNTDFPEEKTILIPFNRLFKTSNKDSFGNKVNGISGIPDGLLIRFDNSRNPIQINILEYECYGESKQRPVQKFNYLNGHIIPQLIRFASAFSIVTDNRIRDENIREWVEKIIQYVEKHELTKVSVWLKKHNPEMPERKHDYEFEKLLIDAFKRNLRIILIIDELSSEQKENIQNIIGSFKLEDDKRIDFVGYHVQLIERIDGKQKDFALTVHR